MSIHPKRSEPEFIVGLMWSTGILLVVVAVPVGICAAQTWYSEFPKERREIIIIGLAFMLLMAFMGIVLYLLGMRGAKRLRRISATTNNQPEDKTKTPTTDLISRPPII
jgi:Na+/proline symporter